MKTSTVAALGAAAAASYSLTPAVHAAGSEVIKIGLVGCGGRGGGAALNALHADSNIKLVALADMFPDKVDSAFKNLKASDAGSQVDIAEDHKFTGWDAYKGVIAACDVVLLATPPHFRPMHLKAAIEAGKHVFCEKPVGVDVPGVKSVMESVKLAQQKNLNLVSGLCFRYDSAKQAIVQKIHDGAVGDILALQANYLTGPLWVNPRKDEWSDMEWQVRNWLYFFWLSGDHIVEQHIHSLDKALWVMKDVPPLKATASGGRTVRTGPEFGNVYDHFATIFEWESGVKCFAHTRQWVNCDADVSDHIFGTKGTAHIMQHRITGEVPFKVPTAKVNMYDAEHIALFNAIRSGKTINNGDYMCKSTLMGIMGRMSAYSGKAVSWDDVLNSKEDFTPPKYEFGPLPIAPVAVPGQTKLV